MPKDLGTYELRRGFAFALRIRRHDESTEAWPRIHVTDALDSTKLPVGGATGRRMSLACRPER
jgi:hypothetical protein